MGKRRCGQHAGLFWCKSWYGTAATSTETILSIAPLTDGFLDVCPFNFIQGLRRYELRFQERKEQLMSECDEFDMRCKLTAVCTAGVKSILQGGTLCFTLTE